MSPETLEIIGWIAFIVACALVSVYLLVIAFRSSDAEEIEHRRGVDAWDDRK